MKASDIMTKDPCTVTPASSVREAAELMRAEDVGLVPVVDTDRRLIGVVTDRDIAIRCIADGKDGSCRISDVMSGDSLITCKSDDSVDNVTDAMRSEKVRRIPIVDERGSLVGIVSQADLFRKAEPSCGNEAVEKISEPGGSHSQS